MCLLYLIEEHYGVRLAAHSLCELTTLIVAYVSWRRTDKTTYAELLLIFTHIYTRHHRLVIEEVFSQCLCQLRLADTRCAEEYEGSDRTLRILQSGTRTSYSVAHGTYGFILTDDTLVELFLKMKKLLTLALHHAAYWYSGPAAYNLSDIISCNFLSDHRCATLCTLQLLLNLLDILFKSYHLRVANLGYTFVIAFTLHALSFELEILHLLLVLLNFVNKSLFAFPLCTEVVLLILQLCNLLVELLNLRLVVLTLDGLTLNLQLLQVAGNLIQFFWYRVTLHSQFGCCLIHQVDSLIREESVRDVSL